MIFMTFFLRVQVSDIRLQDGDVIFIPFIENKLIGGSFKNLIFMNLLKAKLLEDAINLAGGF